MRNLHLRLQVRSRHAGEQVFVLRQLRPAESNSQGGTSTKMKFPKWSGTYMAEIEGLHGYAKL